MVANNLKLWTLYNLPLWQSMTKPRYIKNSITLTQKNTHPNKLNILLESCKKMNVCHVYREYLFLETLKQSKNTCVCGNINIF